MEVEDDEAATAFPCLAKAPSVSRTGRAAGRSSAAVHSVLRLDDKRFWRNLTSVNIRTWTLCFLGLLSLTVEIGFATNAQAVGSYYTDAQADAGRAVFASQ